MGAHGMNNGNGNLNSQQSHLHVAIIMDGSGRWGVARGLPRVEGHRAGRAAVRRTILAALQQGVHTLTLFTFSTDNWGRPENEVAELMHTFEGFFRVDAPALAAQGVRISVMGRRDRLPDDLREAIEKIEARSVREKALHVRLAIDYSGRDAILAAALRFQLSADDSAERFACLLAEGDAIDEQVPDVDLLIRTGGELRLSNCPLWEIAYAELYFTACLWPDFGAADLAAALQDFHTRQRRFGRIPAGIPEAVME
jgi:undecaprenyl diphosphate synthase